MRLLVPLLLLVSTACLGQTEPPPQVITQELLLQLVEKPWDIHIPTSRLGSEGDVLILSEMAADEELPAEYRETAIVALAYKGDATRTTDLLRILRERARSNFWEWHSLIQIFRDFGDVRTISYVARTDLFCPSAPPAERDLIPPPCEDPSVEPGITRRPCPICPIRDYAKRAIDELRKYERRAELMERRADFAAELVRRQSAKVSLSEYLKPLGWTVSWDPETKAWVAEKGTLRQEFPAGKLKVVNGHVYVPERELARLVYRSVLPRAARPEPDMPKVYQSQAVTLAAFLRLAQNPNDLDAIRLLAERGDPFDIVGVRSDPEVPQPLRDAAIIAFSMQGASWHSKEISEIMLTSPDPDIRALCADLFGKMGNRYYREALEKVATSDPYSVATDSEALPVVYPVRLRATEALIALNDRTKGRIARVHGEAFQAEFARRHGETVDAREYLEPLGWTLRWDHAAKQLYATRGSMTYHLGSREIVDGHARIRRGRAGDLLCATLQRWLQRGETSPLPLLSDYPRDWPRPGDFQGTTPQAMTQTIIYELSGDQSEFQDLVVGLQNRGDIVMLSEMAADGELPEQRQVVAAIALGYQGDARQLPELLRIMRGPVTPAYTAKAARSLGMLGMEEAREALVYAAEHEQATPHWPDPPDAYHVRQVAKEALAMLDNPTWRATAASRREDFAREIARRNRRKVPVRGYLEPLGWKVNWDPESRMVVCVKGVYRWSFEPEDVREGSVYVRERELARLAYRGAVLPNTGMGDIRRITYSLGLGPACDLELGVPRDAPPQVVTRALLVRLDGYPSETFLADALSDGGDELILAELAADREAPVEFRRAAVLALGLKGDAIRIPELMRTLRESGDPWQRILAIEALMRLGAQYAGETLAYAAEHDSYTATMPPDYFIAPGSYHPVRKIAERALEHLDDPNFREPDRERRTEFANEFVRQKNAEINAAEYLAPLGWKVTWNPKTKTAVAEKGELRQELAGAKLVNGHTYAPKRELARIAYRGIMWEIR
ncbi:MAG: hypothetical protein ACYC2Y_10465 [Armatimonadota bacterium]